MSVGPSHLNELKRRNLACACVLLIMSRMMKGLVLPVPPSPCCVRLPRPLFPLFLPLVLPLFYFLLLCLPLFIYLNYFSSRWSSSSTGHTSTSSSTSGGKTCRRSRECSRPSSWRASWTDTGRGKRRVCSTCCTTSAGLCSTRTRTLTPRCCAGPIDSRAGLVQRTNEILGFLAEFVAC